ncbi:hypothetical protein Tco_1509141 [Tanacetum coccineum]
MAALKFPSSHNMVAFLDKPAESNAFEQIVDFLNVHPIKYALTVNPTIYTSCIEQFWTIEKVKTVNEEVQIQAQVDKKKVIITKTSVRSDLQLEDAEGSGPNWLFDIDALTNSMNYKPVFAGNQSNGNAGTKACDDAGEEEKKNAEDPGNESGNPTEGKDSDVPSIEEPRINQVLDAGINSTNNINTASDGNNTNNVNAISSTVNAAGSKVNVVDPKTSIKLPNDQNMPELEEIVYSDSDEDVGAEANMNNLDAFKHLEGKRKSKPPGMKRLFKIGRSAQVVSSKDEGLGDQEDASKQGRKIADIDADAEVTLVDETQGRNDEEMFDTCILDGEEVFAEQDVVEKEVSTAEVTTDSTTTTTVDELTLAQTLIEIKAAKPKAVTTAATTTTTAVTRPKARGVIVQEPSEFTTTTSPSQPSQLPQAKDKGKAKMVEPEKPLKKKDQIMFDKEVAQKLQAQLDAELEEEEKLARQREEDANIAEWDNVQAMMDADYELAARLQAD